MLDQFSHTIPAGEEVTRIRLSDWARQQGVSRVTAYRMLKNGILPVASERSPTGRWYVLVPGRRGGRTVIYARTSPGPGQVERINDQVALLAEWAADRHRSVYTVVREVADPTLDPLPRLERLLSDQQVTEIVVRDPAIVGLRLIRLLNAALAPQGRLILTARARPAREDHA